MLINEAADLLKTRPYTPVTGQNIKQLDDAVDILISLAEQYQKMFIKYEILTASFETSDSPEACSKKIDEFCIDTMRGLLGEYYAERISEDENNIKNT